MDAKQLQQEIAAEEANIAKLIHDADCEVAFRRGRVAVKRELLARLEMEKATPNPYAKPAVLIDEAQPFA